MGQTILCEVIAAWEETGEQPDFTQYGFASVLDALKAAQDTMFELGTSCNRLCEKLDSQQSAQHGVHPTVLTVRAKLVMCPQCENIFSVDFPAPHSG